MRSDWVLDVLADLRVFAMSNDLPALAEHLDDTALIALAEISAREEKKAGKINCDSAPARNDTGTVEAGEFA